MLKFVAGATGYLDHCILEYGGGVSEGAEVLVDRGADVVLHECAVTRSNGDGLRIRGSVNTGALRFLAEGGVFGQNAGRGMRVDGSVSATEVQVTGSTFEGNAIGVEMTEVSSAVQLSGNVFKPHSGVAVKGGINAVAHSLLGQPVADDFSGMTTTYTGIEIAGGIANSPGGQLSPDGSAPYRVSSDVSVGEGFALTVSPGTTLLFDSGRWLWVDGVLNVAGQPSSSVLMTASSASRQPGSWPGMCISYTGQVNMSYCTVENGGGSRLQAMVEQRLGGALMMDHCTLRRAAGAALYLRGDSGVGTARANLASCIVTETLWEDAREYYTRLVMGSHRTLWMATAAGFKVFRMP